MSEEAVTIIVAEDDPDDCLLIRQAFEEGPFADGLEFTRDGEELMARLRNQDMFEDRAKYPPPGLLLLDLNMPRKDGREALAEIKADPALRALPVVVLTTSHEDEDVLRSYRLGANSYITKPDTFPELVRAVESLGTYWLQLVELPHQRRRG
jgi:two-component system, response regulator